MTSLSFTKVISFILFIIILVTISIFASHMSNFKKELDDNTKSVSCLEEDNRIITPEEDCYYRYNGSIVLKKLDNVPPNKVCCQLNS